MLACMGYSELIKSLDTIRMYVRSFYVYGFKGRKDFAGKSGRTYDDERRRLENYLAPFMSFRTDESGKVSFVSIDSRRTSRNPLYKIFKAKSFTAMDISLHFMPMDILHGPDEEKSLARILDEISSVYLDGFSTDLLPEESTLRKKLREYCELGLLCARKDGKTMLYRRAVSPDISPDDGGSGLADLISFFSEAAPCGVIGSFMLDKLGSAAQEESDIFEFKHHYISSSIESDLLCTIFEAIRERRSLILTQQKNGRDHPFSLEVVPLVVYQSTQGGRLYLMAYNRRKKYFMPLRVDYILSIKLGEIYEGWEQKRAEFNQVRKHILGVALKMDKKHNDVQTTHVSFTVRFGDEEEFIYERLVREKRIGEVTRFDRNTARFDADDFTAAGYIANFRTALQAVHEKRILRLEYRGRDGRTKKFSCQPCKMEYSGKDGKFRLVSMRKHHRITCNMGRITDCRIVQSPDECADELSPSENRTVTLEIYDERKALERAMYEFAHFEKSCIPAGDGVYRLTLSYDSRDETELVIRVLAFGPMVKVTAPAAFAAIVKDRIRRQLELMRE